MRLEDIVEKKIELNTEEILILKKSELRNIHNINEIEDIYVPTVKLFESFVKFALENDDLLVAVYKSQHPKNTNMWLPHLLYEYYGELYRIDLQFYECNTCSNIYDVGNVATPGLYYNIAMSEYIDVMNKVEKLPKAKCPYCDEVISRYLVIWADDKKQNE